MATICVIGGSGFIGSYLFKPIAQQHTIINIDIKNYCPVAGIKHIQADIADYHQLRSVFPDQVDFVILLAAEHRDDVKPASKYYSVNVKGTQNVLNVMVEKNINRILFTSSVAVYGLNKNQPDEFAPTDPFNDYGKSKLEAERVLKEWYDAGHETRTLIIIRPTVIFGPGNRGNVYNLLAQIASGKFIMIGNGHNRKSMAYVENIAAFMAYCIDVDLSHFHLFNYIDKPDFSTRELVAHTEAAINKKVIPVKIPYWFGYSLAKTMDVICSLAGKKNPISAVRVKKFCAATQFESVTIKATGFKAPFTLEEGLEITTRNILQQKEVVVRENNTPLILSKD